MNIKNKATHTKHFYSRPFSRLNLTLGIVLLCGSSHFILAQSTKDSTQFGNIFSLEAEDIFVEKKEQLFTDNAVGSITGKSENIFEVPVGASVITQKDIKASGCLNIPEALRLLPGVLVRETSSGNYDINIRGLNNLPPSTDFVLQDNSNMLVLIDNRPVFNYFSGGTFWDTLPIDLHDIARIELIRGGVAALYGPNSVAGVINIITQKPEKEGAFSQTELQYGSRNSVITRGSFGMNINDRAKIWASANYQQLDRTQDEMYSLALQKFTTNPDEFINYQTGETLGANAFNAAYPDLNISQRRLGMNLFGTFIPLKNLKTELAVGLQNSQSLRPFAENIYTPLSTMLSKSWYVDVKNYFGNAKLQVAYQNGEQEPGINTLGSHYDFNNLDVLLEYNFRSKSNKFLLRPSLSYQKSVYDDTPYFGLASTESGTGLLNARQKLEDMSASIQSDWSIGKLRLVGSIRIDKYNVPDDWYSSYIAAVNYMPHADHFFRVSYAKSNQSPFFVNILADYQSQFIATANPSLFAQVSINGNATLTLLKAKTLEAAYRVKLAKSWQAEAEFFYIQSEDFNKIVQSNRLIQGNPLIFSSEFDRKNIDMTSSQIGLTVSTEYTFENGKISFFGTWQQTNIQDFSPYSLAPESDPSGTRNIDIQSDITDYRATPRFYGGFQGFLKVSSRFHFSLNAYAFTSQEITHISDAILQREITPFDVKAKILLNSKLTYLPVQQLRLFLNIRNILGQDSREYYFTDRVGSFLLLGMNFEL